MSTEPVLILKEDKVVCFDTLLQVLILKVDTERSAAGERTEQSDHRREKIGEKDNAETQRSGSWRRDRDERGMPPRCPLEPSPLQGAFVDSHRESKSRIGIPYPGYFAKRVRKLLKTKDGSRKKRGKRF